MYTKTENEDEHIRLLEKRLRHLERQVLDSRAELQEARERRVAVASETEKEEEEEEEEKNSGVKLGRGVRNAGNDHVYVTSKEAQGSTPNWNWPMKREEYKRYGRQLIMPEIGIKGQLHLRRSRVLVVGVGGLGCPATAYLAGAGVGTIGLVDGDVVEESNLARQILHTTAGISKSKVMSAIDSAKALNPHIQYRAHEEDLLPETAADIIRQYDIVLDCTDHPTSRYLISDMCVMRGIPLVSASALRVDGQLLVLNNPPRKPGDSSGGPCYRCIFPKPPPPESLMTCGDGGILGPVVGVMGVLQALETIKIIITGNLKLQRNVNHGLPNEAEIQLNEEVKDKSFTREGEQTKAHNMHLFSATPEISFRTVRIRGRRPNCQVCSSNSTITLESIRSGSLDYEQFCGVPLPIAEIDPSERITVQQLAALREKEGVNLKFKQNINKSGETLHVGSSDIQDAHQKGTNDGTKATSSPSYALIDIRNDVQFDIAHLPESISIPFTTIEAYDYSGQATSHDSSSITTLPHWAARLVELPESTPIHVVCRRGNDSQVAVRRLKQLGLDGNGKRYVGDVVGGISEWIKHHGEQGDGFPDY